MPELPEVQTVADDLVTAGLIGTVAGDVHIGWPKTVAEPSPRRFRQRLKGRRVRAVGRRGKYIRIDWDQGWVLLIHLRMTGRLRILPAAADRDKHDHVVIDLNDGRQLRFYDPRKFGRLHLVDDPERILGRLGPEPLAPYFTAKALAQRLARRRRFLKPLLLDQAFIAGLGNIYVDEALWDARLHPLRASDTLDREDVRALHRAIRKVLRRGLQNGGTTLGRGQTTFTATQRGAGRNRQALKVFRKTGDPCPRCRAPVERLVVGQRSTHICPRCQLKT